MTLNNCKSIAERRSYISRWRSRFRRLRVCLSSLLSKQQMRIFRTYPKVMIGPSTVQTNWTPGMQRTLVPQCRLRGNFITYHHTPPTTGSASKPPSQGTGMCKRATIPPQAPLAIRWPETRPSRKRLDRSEGMWSSCGWCCQRVAQASTVGLNTEQMQVS